MKKICIVICYLGRWPEWFRLYLETCKYNPTINWLLFTDCNRPSNTPDNVKFINTTIQDFNSLASRKLDLKIRIKNVYKFCDFKPAYGVIFKDHLKDYDFWGCGDIDLIYGDIRKFITDDILTNYDVIAARKEFVTGHFTLFRNCDKINKLYEKSPDYKMVFQSPKHYAFDEYNKLELYLCSGGSFFDKPTEIETMTNIIKRLADKGHIRALFKTIIKEAMDLKDGRKLRWNKGKLTDIENNEEFLYFHIHTLQNDNFFLISEWNKIPDSFFITKKGIFYEEITGIKRFFKVLKKYLKFKITKKGIDRSIGRIGIFLENKYPKLYYRIKKD